MDRARNQKAGPVLESKADMVSLGYDKLRPARTASSRKRGAHARIRLNWRLFLALGVNIGVWFVILKVANALL